MDKNKRKQIGYTAGIIGLAVVILAMLAVYINGGKELQEVTAEDFDWETVDVTVRGSGTAFVAEEVTLSSDTLEYEIHNMGELVTAEYHYRHAESYQSTLEALGIKWDLTTTSFVYMIDGDIYAGIDLNQVTVDVDNAQKKVLIHLPDVEITHNELNQDSFEAVDSKSGFFNDLKPEQVNESYAHIKEVEEAKAIENGILDRAKANAESMIESLLRSSSVTGEYSIVFE